jgi:hypothetical protein
MTTRWNKGASLRFFSRANRRNVTEPVVLVWVSTAQAA